MVGVKFIRVRIWSQIIHIPTPYSWWVRKLSLLFHMVQVKRWHQLLYPLTNTIKEVLTWILLRLTDKII